MRTFPLPPAALLAVLVGGCGTPVDVTPPVEPVASITLSGPAYVKVGDQYPIVATLRLEDGSEVQRPITWRVTDVARGTVSSSGVVVVATAERVVVRARVDGVAAEHAVIGYDWQASGGAAGPSLLLHSEAPLVNHYGSAERAALRLSCSDGTFGVTVMANGVQTTGTTVRVAFDDGDVIDEAWQVDSTFGVLTRAGKSNADQRAFATTIAASRRFRVGFTEWDGTAHTAEFRVSGLTSRLAPLLAGCAGE